MYLKIISCKNCNKNLKNPNANFCNICGFQQDPALKLCKNCNQKLNSDWLFCENCGSRIRTINVVER